jgi:hypothetical protein
MDIRIHPLEQNLCERDWLHPHDDFHSNVQTCNDSLELKINAIFKLFSLTVVLNHFLFREPLEVKKGHESV